MNGKLLILLLTLLLLAQPLRAGAAKVPEDLLSAAVLESAPDFSGEADGAPFIRYGGRDALGRATAAFALLGPELLTSDARPDLSVFSPPGLHNAPYPFIRDRWVYNRCHLIGHQFGGASDLSNLIAGTHALNHTYMLAWENRVAGVIRRKRLHVFYRVTPLYEGDELVCRQVLLEACSCDGGKTLRFAVLCPNAQPGVAIDYATGYTTLADEWEKGGTSAGARRHILNTRTGKFHLPSCRDAASVSARNRKERVCPREELLREGYLPCGKCRP